MVQSLQSLDRARRDWLGGLARAHAANANADTALALAQGAWRCGEYGVALEHFVEARDRAPARLDVHLALLRAASMCALAELERDALEHAMAGFAASPDLQWHAARMQLTGDPAGAYRRLQPFTGHPQCREFADALAAIVGDGVTAIQAPAADAAMSARRASLGWVRRHSSDPAVHVGMPAHVLLRALQHAPATGLTLECGVYFGRSLRIIAERTRGAVHGFDSFEGLPEAWNANEGPGSYSTAGRLPDVAPNVTLHRGWFEDTLPPFFAAQPDPVRLLHVDCDLYSSTRTVLEAADHGLVPGSVVVFDDLLGYPGHEEHELRAFEEFAAERGLGWELLAACLLGREVAIRVTSR